MQPTSSSPSRPPMKRRRVKAGQQWQEQVQLERPDQQGKEEQHAPTEAARRAFVLRLNQLQRVQKDNMGLAPQGESSSESECSGLRKLLTSSYTGYEDARISKKALQILEANPEELPGHSCCMHCAKSAKELLSCNRCQRVVYCSQRCFDLGYKFHRRRCKYLRRAFDDNDPDSLTFVRVSRRIHRLLNTLERENPSQNVTEGMQEFYRKYLPRISLFSDFGMQLSAYLSYPMTILEAAIRYDSTRIVESSEAEPYIIHVLGAAHLETAHPHLWGALGIGLQNRFKIRGTLKIYLIGPEAIVPQPIENTCSAQSFSAPGITVISMKGKYSDLNQHVRRNKRRKHFGFLRDFLSPPMIVAFFNVTNSKGYSASMRLRSSALIFSLD